MTFGFGLSLSARGYSKLLQRLVYRAFFLSHCQSTGLLKKLTARYRSLTLTTIALFLKMLVDKTGCNEAEFYEAQFNV